MDYLKFYNEMSKYNYNLNRVSCTRSGTKFGFTPKFQPVDYISEDEQKWIEYFIELFCNEKTKNIIDVYFSNNLYLKEVAKILEVSEMNVSNKLHNAYKKISECMHFIIDTPFKTYEERLEGKEYSGICMAEFLARCSLDFKKVYLTDATFSRNNIKTLQDLIDSDWDTVKGYRGIGVGTLDILNDYLLSLGINKGVVSTKGGSLEERLLLSETKEEAVSILVQALWGTRYKNLAHIYEEKWS